MTANTSRKLVLIDAYSLLFRAHFANPYLSTADGRPTGALFGFSMMLLSILNTHHPDSVVVCWDAPERTHRKQEFEGYKAHRPEVDPHLKAQMPDARRIVEAFGIQSAELGGYEADDLIGTLSVRGADVGMQVVILTGDSDQLQLVRDSVSVEICQRGVTEVKPYDADAVQARYGVAPDRIPDWKGLVGDTSDNIPGVPGIGEKTATALLQTWGTVEGILEHVEEVTPNKARLSLLENADAARLSKRLATIVCDAPIDTELAPYAPAPAVWEQVRTLFAEYQFKSLLARLPSAHEPAKAPVTEAREAAPQRAAAVRRIENENDFGAAVTAAHKSGTVALSARPAPDRPLHDGVSALGIAFGDEAFVMGVQAAPSGGLFDEPESDFAFAATPAQLSQLLDSVKVSIIGHNAKPLLQMLSNSGGGGLRLSFDTMIAAYLLDSNRSTYTLDDLSRKYLDRPYTEASGPDAPAVEAALILQLVEPMRAQLEELGMTDVVERVDLPLAPVLAEVERAGLLIDRPYLGTLSIRLKSEMDALASEIYSLAGEEFNIGSTKQLQVVLFDKLQLPTGRKTKTGFSTGGDLLETLAADYSIARKIIDYREISKLKATYADSLVKLADPDTGRVHTTLNQTVASTGRLSSSDPNLQNIPIRSELGREIRRAFIAPKGRVLLSCDYSQIELRVLAHITSDPALSEAFKLHEDVHAATAARVFGVAIADVTSSQRRSAKTINFAVIYGQSAFALANTLGVDTKTAGEWIKEYFNRLPGVQRYIAETTAFARDKRYVETLMGRRRYLPELDSPNHTMRQFAERAAVNMPIQGTAADIMKLAMIEVFHAVQSKWSDRCKLLLQVHDELLLEVDADALDEVAEGVREIMQAAYPLNVPLTADAKSGVNWADMKAV